MCVKSVCVMFFCDTFSLPRRARATLDGGLGGILSASYPFRSPVVIAGTQSSICCHSGPTCRARLLVGLAVIFAAAWGCSSDPPPVSQALAEKAAASSENKEEGPGSPLIPVRLDPLRPITLDPGGQATVELHVERGDLEGPIQVEVEGTVAGLTANVPEIPAGQSNGQIELAADEKLGDKEETFELKAIIRAGSLETSQPLSVTITKVSLPTFLPAPAIVLQPGTATTVTLKIERQGNEGVIALAVEEVPAKVTAKVEPIADGRIETALELTAAADAAEASASIRVAATCRGRPIGLDVPLHVDKHPYQVQSFRVVTLKPGETQQVAVPVTRRRHKGSIQLEAGHLPDGVSVASVEVPANESAAKLQFAAAEDAPERVRSARIDSRAGHLASSDPIVIRVSRGETGFLPQEVTANKELFKLLRRGSFGGRLTAQSKNALLEAYGGTPESEAAVLRGLGWLAEHQHPDGRWSLKSYSETSSGCECRTEFEQEVVDSDTAGTDSASFRSSVRASRTTALRKARRSWRSIRRPSRTASPFCSATKSSRETRRKSAIWEAICTLTQSPPWPCVRPTGFPPISD